MRRTAVGNGLRPQRADQHPREGRQHPCELRRKLVPGQRDEKQQPRQHAQHNEENRTRGRRPPLTVYAPPLEQTHTQHDLHHDQPEHKADTAVDQSLQQFVGTPLLGQ